jgi:5-methylcytosine-specific restriction endonuclease McrA
MARLQSEEPERVGQWRRSCYDRHCDERKQYHIAWRSANPEKVLRYGREWREKNPERAKEASRRYESQNRDKRNAKTRASYARHRDARLAYTRQYWKDRPEEACRHAALRRGRKRNAEGFYRSSHADAILDMQHGHCAYCDETERLHLDHVIPLTRGGSNYPWNLQWLCAHHNISKGNKTDAEYRAHMGMPQDVPISMQIWIAIFAA